MKEEEEFLKGISEEAFLQYKNILEDQGKAVKEFREKLGDTTIRVDGVVQVVENLKGTETLLEKTRKLKPLWRLRDGKGEIFYLFDPSQKELPNFPELTKIRDRIVEQRTAFNKTSTEQRTQIEVDYSSSRGTPDSARPYQDYLRSNALGKIFEGSKKP